MSRGAGDTVEFMRHGDGGVREFIAMGIPSFGLVNIFWASRAFGQLRHPMNRDIRQYILLGTEVGLARNAIVARALEAEADGTRRCSHVFFIDDDVLVHPDALLKLLADDRDIVGGLYFAKTSVPQPLVLHGESTGIARSWRPGDIVDCWAHGMGCTLVKAEVFKRLRDETDLGVDEQGHPQWFRTERDATVLRSDGVPAVANQTEDIYFLRRAAAIGYQPCVDTSPQTFAFHWSQQELRGYPLAQWREYQDRGTITWPIDGEAPVVWSMAA